MAHHPGAFLPLQPEMGRQPAPPQDESVTRAARDRHDLLAQAVQRTEYFATDATDEFQVIREDGTTQGIFKVWSPSIIPTLETGITDAAEAAATWVDRLRNKPLGLFECLEQWRATAAIADKRLQHLFEQQPLPAEPEAAITELYARLGTSFAYLSPFYNLEALVADSRPNRHDNPIDFTEENTSGGKLDAVAMLLPAALGEHVVAEPLNWNGLTWQELDARAEAMRTDFLQGRPTAAAQQYRQISKIAALANIEPADILFAANALQFIPNDVGGKRDDLPQAEAAAALDAVLDAPTSEITTGVVAKDANALIRFLNWSTVTKSDDNFNGKYWAYDSVCATAAQLTELVKAHSDIVFKDDYASIFTGHLAPQLDNLDAASAKGRFMGQLFLEGKLAPALTEKIYERSAEHYAETLTALEHIKQQEMLLPIGAKAPTLLVGGKAIGLNRATQLFGPEKVLGGYVITTEAVADWLHTIEGVDVLVQQMDSLPDAESKVAAGKAIIDELERADVPVALIEAIQRSFPDNSSIVLRSSSFDEDVDIIGPAPGVYESEVNIPVNDGEAVAERLKTVVGSFFSDKAISFRELKGLRHTPLFAVLAQEFQPGAGGSIFIKGGTVSLNIAPSPSQVNDIDRAMAIEEHSGHMDGDIRGIRSLHMTAEHITDIIDMAAAAEAIWGPSDLEFVVNPATQSVQLLQMRSLERPTEHRTFAAAELPDTVIPIDDLNALPDLPANTPVALAIGPDINLEQFQGPFFRWIIGSRNSVQSIVIPHAIPGTCHFVNIIESLGISVRVANET